VDEVDDVGGATVTEIVVPVSAGARSDRGAAIAVRLAGALEVPVRLVHVEPAGSAEVEAPRELLAGLADGPVRPTWEVVRGADLVEGVLRDLAPGTVIVMQTEHANRWSGKASVAEHVVDAWPGTTVLVGPHVDPGADASGPVVVGVDGSPDAERSIGPARQLARVLGVDVLVARVVPAEGPEAEPAREYLDALVAERLPGARARVVRSNDPVSALVALATDESAALVVLSSHGDRTSARASISRTCTGVAAEAAQPLMVVGPAVSA
jgi:nucleotide-binding universal stress UspA family protein